MKVEPVKPVVKTKPITKRTEFIYQSEIDPAVIIHSNKTHRTVSEAFRDAEYACSITKFKNDWQLSLEFLGEAIYGFWMVGMFIAIPALLFFWLTK